MNKRFILALVLTAIVIVITPVILPGTRRPIIPPVPTDTVAGKATTVPSDTTHAVVVTAPTVAAAPIRQAARPVLSNDAVDTTIISSARATYAFSSAGAAPMAVTLDSFISKRPVGGAKNVQLVDPWYSLARYQLVLAGDTIALDTIPFTTQPRPVSSTGPLTYTGAVAGHTVQIEYSFARDVADEYLFHTRAHVSGAPPGSALIIHLPPALRSNEPDTLDDLNHLAISYRPARGDVGSIAFRKVDSLEMRFENGPINWVAERNKYFLVAIRAASTPFSIMRMHGMPRTGKVAGTALTSATLPLEADGSAKFDIYAGPQSFERLRRMGGDFDQVNPYAGWLHGVVQPFATIVMRALLWMKHSTQLNYGWVLVLFGISIRLVLWPLNQSAMRTSMKMQRLQPELQAIQKKYSDDPKKQQEHIMKVYKDHGMSPLSPLMGCLPMLIPMPVLFALYYVFQNTIEFRGVSFLWLPDISLKDPYYITPLFMGISMYVMSWIGMRNSPPNAQAKMMSYMMPVMLTVLFLNFASGLNLYYAVQNVAAIPQQWLLARERAKEPALSSPPPEKRRA